MLTCKQITEVVTDYLERRMTLMDRLRFHIHLGMCRHCRAYLRQMKATVAALGRLPDEVTIPPPVRDELRRRFADWHKSRSTSGRQDNPESA